MKYIGIIVALPEEQEAVKDIMENTETKSIFGVDFLIGKLNKIDCILTLSGIGKVNAARTTQILIDKFDINYIINIGVAGAINHSLKIGDVIIGKSIVQHDFDISAFGHSKGYIPGIGNTIDSDNNLLNTLQTSLKHIEEKSYKIKLGTIATGDIFCTQTEAMDKIASKFKADCVEMEAGAIAQVSKLCDIPFIVIRSISDIPNGKNVNEYEVNLKTVSKRAASILMDFLKVDTKCE